MKKSEILFRRALMTEAFWQGYNDLDVTSNLSDTLIPNGLVLVDRARNVGRELRADHQQQLQDALYEQLQMFRDASLLRSVSKFNGNLVVDTFGEDDEEGDSPILKGIINEDFHREG